MTSNTTSGSEDSAPDDVEIREAERLLSKACRRAKPAWIPALLHTSVAASLTGLPVAFVARHPDLPWACYLLSAFVVAVGMLKWFLIAHDACHRAFVPFGNAAFEFVGYIIGVGNPTYGADHVKHHAHHGVLDQKEYDICETVFLTVADYMKLPRPIRIILQAVYTPLGIHFIAAPLGLIYQKYRQIYKQKTVKWAAHHTIQWGALVGCWMLGPMVLFTVVFAALMFFGFALTFIHLMHAFEDSVLSERQNFPWRYKALANSAQMVYPRWLDVILMGSGYHGLHHLVPSAPSYALRSVWEGLRSDLREELLAGPISEVPLSGIYDALRWNLIDPVNGGFANMATVEASLTKLGTAHTPEHAKETQHS